MSTTKHTRRRAKTTRNYMPPGMPTRAQDTAPETPAAKLAKGSQRIGTMRGPAPHDDAAGRVEAALRARPTSAADLAKLAGVAPERVTDILDIARLRGHVVNLGSAERPCWFWRPGDEGTTAELKEVVGTLIAWRPFTLQELIEATGARRNRISGVLARFHEDGKPITNLDRDVAQAARWFMLPSKREK